ncbi:MAG: hypothetical protein ACRDZM_04000 [Acidimicrobiia bacterium]
MSDEYLPGRDGEAEEADDDVKPPFSFKLMIVLTVIYLGWRLIQGIVWVVEKVTS